VEFFMQFPDGNPMNGSTPQSEPSRDMILNHGSVEISDALEKRAGSHSPSITMNGLMRALQRHWMLAFSLGLVVAVGSAAAAWYFLPPAKHTARVLLRVHSVPQTVMFREVYAPTDFSAYQRTQIALVKSREVLTAAISNKAFVPDQVRIGTGNDDTANVVDVSELSMIRTLREKRGSDEVVNWLERELQVDFSVGPELLRIALSGDQPEELKILVAAVRDAYLKKIVENENTESNKHLDYMEKLAKQFADDVTRKRNNLTKVSELLGTNDSNAMATIRNMNEVTLSRLRGELLDAQSELRKVEVEAAGFDKDAQVPGQNPAGKAPLPGDHPSPPREITVPDRMVDDLIRNDPQGRAVLDRKLKTEANIRDTQGLFRDGDKNPIVERYRQELAGAEAELAALRASIRPQLQKEFAQKVKEEKETSDARLQQRIDLLRRYEAKLQDEVKNYEGKIKKIGTTTLETESYKAELIQAEDLSRRATTQLEALKVERKAPDRITKQEPAYASHPDEQKRRLVAAGVAGGGSLFLVLFVIAWWELGRQRVSSVDEVVHSLGMKLMGTVPALPSRRQLRLTSNGQADIRWQSILTESVDTARTMLLHKAASESLKMVMVTSAVGGEGKTSLSSHLAASLARAGKKTLLLDADLRNPAIHRLFGIDRTPGLCELLRGEVDLADAIQPTPAPGLSLIPAGLVDDLALQGLAQDNMRKICEPLKAEFDFIVVDSAPVLPVADSLLIGQMVDGVIFSILYEVSRFPKVYAAHQRLEMLGIRMLGAVVSGAKVDDYGPDYSYGPEVHA
jgi:capsular exopolysaccharide synthesis family protein